MRSFISNHKWESKIVDNTFLTQYWAKSLQRKKDCLEHYELSTDHIEKVANDRDMSLSLLTEEETGILRKGIVSNTESFDTDQLLQEEFWTKEKLIDMVFHRLATVRYVIQDPSGNEIELPKYLLQADFLAPKFAIFDPPPVFKINLTDLGTEIIQRLFILDENSRGKVILEAVSRIFRKLFPFYYNQGIAEFLRVEVVE